MSPSRGLVRCFWRLLTPYDLYERHVVVARLLGQALGDERQEVHILDVGGRAELLQRFLPYRVLSVNTDPSGDLLASGCALPFADGSFTGVVSLDTLEHLPVEARLPFVRECLRVARRCVLVAAPFGSDGHIEYERRLDSLYRSEYGRSHLYLSEHIRYGLPGIVELDRLVDHLQVACARRFFAGDYVWQGRHFERALLRYQGSGVLARLGRIHSYVASLAIFHPIRLLDQPDARANRFYLLLEKG